MNAFHSISSWWKRFSRKRRLSMLNATDNVEEWYTPVSYTHLDVYKRQVLASCASQKRVIYLQDAQADEQIKIAQDYQIRIKPLDRLTVVVNSRDPELAAPFNTSTSFNSLTGTPLSTYSSNATSLQIRTVDEDGNLDMPIIGPIQCKGCLLYTSRCV